MFTGSVYVTRKLSSIESLEEPGYLWSICLCPGHLNLPLSRLPSQEDLTITLKCLRLEVTHNSTLLAREAGKSPNVFRKKSRTEYCGD